MRHEGRLRKLEAEAGGGSCARCSGVVEVVINGELDGLTRDGVPLDAEQRRRFEAEEGPNKACLVCGQEPLMITMKGLDRADPAGGGDDAA